MVWIVAALCFGVSVHAENGHGSIAGTVRLRGKAPAVPWLQVEADTEVCGQQARPAKYLALSASNTVANVIVYLQAAPAATGPADPIMLGVQGCDFVPRLQVARRDATLVLQNNDAVLHVVRLEALQATNAPQAIAEVAMPYAGFEKRLGLDRFAEPVLLRATEINGRRWMTAYLAVLPHRWATLTGSDGAYRLPDVPPGVYRLCAWHELLGVLAAEVKVARGRVSRADLEFAAAPP
jgi:hypothetical protein